MAATAPAPAFTPESAPALAPAVPAASWWALTVIVLATFVTFFDQVVFGMLGERIKHDFHLTDAQLGFLAGPASVIAFLFVGIPLARLADVWPRKYVLGAGAAVFGGLIALGGIAQSFTQFVAARVFLAAGGAAHAPASYSLLADAFPARRLTRAFALLQFGFIGGTTLGPLVGGRLVVMTAAWPPSHLGPLTLFGWQWLLIATALPMIGTAALFLTVREPRRGGFARPSEPSLPPAAGLGARLARTAGWDALKAVRARGHVYYPLFGALALSAIDSFGLAFWRVPFMVRTYHWNEAQIGAALGPVMLVGSLAGLLFGGVLVEGLAKRHADANVRAAAICIAGAAVSAVISPLMPTAPGSVAVAGLGVACGIAGAVPQNAAVQRIAPDAMRGQVTAFYLFMFTFFGAMGSFVVGLIAQYGVGDPSRLWLAMVIAAATLLPAATVLMALAMRPYREEVARLDALETPR